VAVAGASVGSVPGISRKYGATMNSMHILYKAGLSTANSSKGDDMDMAAKAAAALREKLRTLEKHFQNDRGIDVTREVRQKGHAAHGLNTFNTALEKANDLKLHPFMEKQEVLTYEERADFASRGRKRVAPPMDHAVKSMGAGGGGGRRASCGVRSGDTTPPKQEEPEPAETTDLEVGGGNERESMFEGGFTI